LADENHPSHFDAPLIRDAMSSAPVAS
jgi:hypothetical protein